MSSPDDNKKNPKKKLYKPADGLQLRENLSCEINRRISAKFLRCGGNASVFPGTFRNGNFVVEPGILNCAMKIMARTAERSYMIIVGDINRKSFPCRP